MYINIALLCGGTVLISINLNDIVRTKQTTLPMQAENPPESQTNSGWLASICLVQRNLVAGVLASFFSCPSFSKYAVDIH